MSHPEALINKVLELLDAGLSNTETGKRLGLTRNQVGGIAVRHQGRRKWPMKHGRGGKGGKVFTTETKAEVLYLAYDENMPLSDIAKKMGLTYNSVYEIIRNWGNAEMPSQVAPKRNSPALIDQVLKLVEAHEKYEVIALELDISVGKVAGIVHRHKAKVTS